MANKSPLQDAMDGIGRSVKTVMKDIHRTVGSSSDPDVRTYSRLERSDFEKLEEAFGAEAVSKYVREMELRKMSNG